MISIGKFKEFLKIFKASKKLDSEDDVEGAFGSVIKTFATLKANVKDDSLASTLVEILGTEPIDIPPAEPADYESPPGTVSPHYVRRSIPVPNWDEFYDENRNLIKWKQGLTISAAVISSIAEIASVGQIDNILNPINVILNTTGIIGLAENLTTIENKIKVEEVWTQYWMRRFKPTIPRERDLITLYRHKIITFNEYIETMGRLGYRTQWARGMYDSTNRYPGASELLNMLRRGLIDEAKFNQSLMYQGFHGDEALIYLEMKEPLHTTSALITQVVKEVITPEQFIESMALQGWSKEEAQKYWDVHWRIVSLDDLQDMRNRGLIDDTEYAKQLIIHDYPPEWTDKLTAISYKNPTMLQFRQITEYTDLTESEIDAALKTFGYAPEWESVMRKFLTSRRLMNERTRMINELETNFIKGYINESAFRTELSGMGLSEDVTDLRLGRAKLKYSREVKDDWQKIYIAAYRNAFIDEQQFWQELTGLGIREEIINIILMMESVRKKPTL